MSSTGNGTVSTSGYKVKGEFVAAGTLEVGVTYVDGVSISPIAKIGAGKMTLEKVPVDLTGTAVASMNMVRLSAKEKGVVLKSEFAAAVPRLYADERRITQVLLNLLSNAIKFTPNGGSVSLAARREGNNVVIEISDTGVGIDAGELTRLGEVFYQAGGAYNRRFEGTGLGLSIVRGLVGLHGMTS